MSAPTTASNQWLEQQLSQLLSSPYIHFRPLTNGGLRMGHGPIDLFSTRFNNLFSSDATGVVAGSEVDRAGLKEALLALQRKWDADSAHFTEVNGLQDGHLGTNLQWTPKNAEDGQNVEVSATATVQQDGGATRITTLRLDGDQALFTSPK
ncbi:uncharacterized protein FIBRA_02074 [Fibroporia radiculosa]|uniref:Uncharacterized protein n=1 Tax=Fibroporia radiculosa TaxID=599839 RepID=J4G1C2_9APHY|nr:uncharacterized protein FIBRA_02074 [Fibroporia radiculosa]CCM00048.1 predicted protein [Fibroporia radiculosa]